MTELDRYLDDLGYRLEAARPPRPRRRPRTRLVALVATGALALAAALAVSLIGGGSATDHHRALPVGPEDALARTRAALTVPPGQMLHMRLSIQVQSEAYTKAEEMWVAAGKPHWRTTWEQSDDDQLTVTFADGAYSQYERSSNRIKRVTGYADDSPQAKVRSLLGIGHGDFAEELRTQLAKGKLADAGEQQVNGRTVRRLESKDKDDLTKALRVYTFDVDPQTFEPVGGEQITYLPPRKRGGPRREEIGRMRFKVDVYEHVPIDDRLLAVPTNARTKVTEITKAELTRRVNALRRWQNKCKQVRKHDPRADCGESPGIWS